MSGLNSNMNRRCSFMMDEILSDSKHQIGGQTADSDDALAIHAFTQAHPENIAAMNRASWSAMNHPHSMPAGLSQHMSHQLLWRPTADQLPNPQLPVQFGHDMWSSYKQCTDLQNYFLEAANYRDYFARPYLWSSLFSRLSFHKRKGGQVRFTNTQTQQLEKKFDSQKYLSPSERKKVAKTLQLSERQVKTWFQNRRAKWRRLQQDNLTIQEKSSTSGTSSIDNTISDHSNNEDSSSETDITDESDAEYHHSKEADSLVEVI